MPASRLRRERMKCCHIQLNMKMKQDDLPAGVRTSFRRIPATITPLFQPIQHCAFLAVLVLISLILTSCGGLKEDLVQVYTEHMNSDRQAIFKQLHPVGTAHSVVVHDVDIQWRGGAATGHQEDIQGTIVTFTIYWEGPVTSDGYTKVAVLHDWEVNRFTDGQILATNGITNGDAMYGIGWAAGFLISALR